MSEQQIKIEKGIPLPPPTRVPRKPGLMTQAISGMEIGDSFFREGEGKSFIRDIHARGKRVGVKLAVRKQEGGIRVWRVA